MAKATGTFEVKMTPQAVDEDTQEAALGRFSLDKQYHGDLEASAKGTMLSVGTGVPNSALMSLSSVLPARWQVKAAPFALKHDATMYRGEPNLTISVVPDSATAELTGLTGALLINVVDGQHTYDFEYTLA